MKEIQDVYRGWNITVAGAEKLCSHFSFTITDPSGKAQNVAMGGDNAERALERAKELIDMEVEFAAEE
ncbi:hypothetical protein FCL47_07635 [Desulfopila sp. IMCC35006]|uniref:hypothetical protein n=1 Tax=Desulfopila sp. IMCC35006 TaxID=2569542 RepID=UPI0010AD4FA3|nr:hypothetical protein [Desulfopila sp. IMCC35006]TKB27043.1 hypothetical protein FCL47_07635 [Desulfopila sp. IMCC35006]